MKFPIAITTLLLLCSGLNAQITGTIADFGSIGDTHLLGNDSLADPGQMVSAAGPAQTWDYSALNLHTWDTIKFEDPATLPFGSLFPSTNLAITIGDVNNYVEATANSITLAGQVIAIAGLELPVGLLDKIDQWQLPLNYQDAWLDTGRVDTTLEDTFTGLADSLRAIRWQTLDASVDAWGALTTVNGTYDVLRIKTIEHAFDTVWGKLPFIGWQQLATQQETTYKYHYVANNEDYPVLELQTSASSEIEAAQYKIGTAPLVIANAENNLACTGPCIGSTTAMVAGGSAPYTYQWDDPASQATAHATGLCAGSYNITITDAVGATVVAMATVGQAAPIVVDSVLQVNESVASNDGAITVNVSGGTPDYSFLWSNGDTTQNIANLIGGSYTITVTDATGCTGTLSFTLSSLSPVVTGTASVDNNATCNGMCDGQATAAATGGFGAYNYAWNVLPPQNSATATGLCPGIHTVIITDSAGTIDSATVTITQPDAIVIDSVMQLNESFLGNDGSLDIEASGGVGGYTYEWNNAATTQDLQNLVGGTYTISVTDSSGCGNKRTFMLSSAVGIADQIQVETTFSVWPIPARETITISSNSTKPATVFIHNLLGELVATHRVAGTQSRISIADLPEGMYVLAFGDGNAQQGKRLVVARP